MQQATPEERNPRAGMRAGLVVATAIISRIVPMYENERNMRGMCQKRSAVRTVLSSPPLQALNNGRLASQRTSVGSVSPTLD
jgi:hypothetical protein